MGYCSIFLRPSKRIKESYITAIRPCENNSNGLAIRPFDKDYYLTTANTTWWILLGLGWPLLFQRGSKGILHPTATDIRQYRVYGDDLWGWWSKKKRDRFTGPLVVTRDLIPDIWPYLMGSNSKKTQRQHRCTSFHFSLTQTPHPLPQKSKNRV